MHISYKKRLKVRFSYSDRIFKKHWLWILRNSEELVEQCWRESTHTVIHRFRRAQTLLQATFASLFIPFTPFTPIQFCHHVFHTPPWRSWTRLRGGEGVCWTLTKKRKGNETWAKNIAGRRYNAHAHNRKNRYFGIKLIIQERGRIGDSIGIQYLQI